MGGYTIVDGSIAPFGVQPKSRYTPLNTCTLQLTGKRTFGPFQMYSTNTKIVKQAHTK